MQGMDAQIYKIENEQGVAIMGLQLQLHEQLETSVNKLIRHLKSKEIQESFSRWSYDDDVTEAKSWSIARHEIVKAFDSRLRLYIENWEEENHVFSATIACLKERITKELDLVESSLRQLEDCIVNDNNPTASRVTYTDNDDSLTFSTRQMVFIGLTSPLWLTFAIAFGVLFSSVLGAMAIKDKVNEANMLSKYQKDPPGFLAPAWRR